MADPVAKSAADPFRMGGLRQYLRWALAVACLAVALVIFYVGRITERGMLQFFLRLNAPPVHIHGYVGGGALDLRFFISGLADDTGLPAWEWELFERRQMRRDDVMKKWLPLESDHWLVEQQNVLSHT